jgi:methylated-DNA-[protein]-cysteine S-methyltransferase
MPYLRPLPATDSPIEIYTTIRTPLGELLAFADRPGHLTGVYFADGQRTPTIPPKAVYDETAFDEFRDRLDSYFAGEPVSFDLPVALVGHPFQRRIWEAVRAIPYGTTCSYREIASKLGHPRAARAVGYANARNPLCLVVPCHRVIGTSGELTGYAGGLDRKQTLLRHEAAHAR